MRAAVFKYAWQHAMHAPPHEPACVRMCLHTPAFARMCQHAPACAHPHLHAAVAQRAAVRHAQAAQLARAAQHRELLRTDVRQLAADGELAQAGQGRDDAIQLRPPARDGAGLGGRRRCCCQGLERRAPGAAGEARAARVGGRQPLGDLLERGGGVAARGCWVGAGGAA